MKVRLLVFLLGIIMASCKPEPPMDSNKVHSFGNRQLILNESKLTGVVRLDTLFSSESLYAIGPVHGLKGEVTVYNDLVSIASIDDDKPSISQAKNTKAIFLIKTNENDWMEYDTERELVGLNAVEEYIKELLISTKRNTSMATPFRIETRVSRLEYHIIFKKDSLYHNKTEHQKAKVKFKLEDTEINIIGFWVDAEREGKLTHPGKRTHLHFMTKDNTTSGHIDDIRIPKSSKIYLPEK